MRTILFDEDGPHDLGDQDAQGLHDTVAAAVGEPTTTVRHPHVHVQLTGTDSNAFSVLGRVRAAMRRASIPLAEVDEFTREAMSGDYDHLLRVAMRWVDVT